MKRSALYGLALALLAWASPALSQASLPPNSVWGRLGISGGPPQAIPFANLATSMGFGPLSTIGVGTGLVSSGGVLNIANQIAAGGPAGTATVVPILTWNAQGQLTVVSSATITPAFSSITGTPTTLAGYGITSPLPVAQGGIGVTSLVNHGILLGGASTSIGQMAAMTDGQLPVGQTGTDPLQRTVSGAMTLAATGVATINLGAGATVTGNLPVTNLNSGTSASANTVWRGDAQWTSVNLASAMVSGILAQGNGGTGAGSFSAGSIIFGSGTALTQNNAQFFWDNSAIGLGIGTTTLGSTGEHLTLGFTAPAAHVAARIMNSSTSGFSSLWFGSANEGFIRYGSASLNKLQIVATTASVPVTIATAGTDRLTVTDTGVQMSGWFQGGVTTVAGLPTCNAGQEGTRSYVTDQNTAVAYRGAVTGAGTTRQAVLCSNSAWIQD